MEPPDLFALVNGQFVSVGSPGVAALDRGLLYGDGLFETIRAYDGVPFLFEAHIERLNRSAAELRICDGLDPSALRQDVEKLLARNGLRDAYLRITLTRGIHTGPLELQPAERPTTCVVARPLHLPPPERYDPGTRCVLASFRRSAESPLPRHKTLNYLENLLARTEARQRGADDAIFLNTRGEVAEATSSNIFLVLGGQLVTPSLEANILPGVTRAKVIELARDLGIEVLERQVWPYEFRGADEVFLTNSVAEILPVREVEGRTIGTGGPGPVTARLQTAYREAAADYVARHATGIESKTTGEKP